MAVNIHWRPDEVPSLSLGAKPARCSDHSGAVTAECTNHYYTLLPSLAPLPLPPTLTRASNDNVGACRADAWRDRCYVAASNHHRQQHQQSSVSRPTHQRMRPIQDSRLQHINVVPNVLNVLHL